MLGWMEFHSSHGVKLIVEEVAFFLPFSNNCDQDFCDDQLKAANANLVNMDCQMMEANSSSLPDHIVRAANAMEADLPQGLERAVRDSKKLKIRSCVPGEVINTCLHATVFNLFISILSSMFRVYILLQFHAISRPEEQEKPETQEVRQP